MLTARFHVVDAILWLLVSISAGRADPLCDHRTHGQPNYSDCRETCYSPIKKKVDGDKEKDEIECTLYRYARMIQNIEKTEGSYYAP